MLSIRMRAALICLAFLLASGLQGAPLTRAEVTRIINVVDVVVPRKAAHPAVLHEVIKDEIGLRTGSKSRSELMFEDHTLTRIGPETYFSFKAGTRDITLQQGTILLQVPKGLGGVRLRTAYLFLVKPMYGEPPNAACYEIAMISSS